MDKPSTDPAPAGPAPSTGGGPASQAGRRGLLPALMWVLAALVQFAGASPDAGLGAGTANRVSPADIASLLSSPAAGRDTALSQQEDRQFPARPPSRMGGGPAAVPATGPAAFFLPAPLGAPAAAAPVHVAAGFLDSRFPTGPPATA